MFLILLMGVKCVGILHEYNFDPWSYPSPLPGGEYFTHSLFELYRQLGLEFIYVLLLEMAGQFIMKTARLDFS